jgi:hypothetical protein
LGERQDGRKRAGKDDGQLPVLITVRTARRAEYRQFWELPLAPKANIIRRDKQWRVDGRFKSTVEEHMPFGPDERAVVKSVAKGAVEGALRPLHDLIRALAGPAVQELGETWHDQVRVWRHLRAVRLAARVQQMMAPLGLNLRPVSLKLLLPAIEFASLEDHDELQDRWAGLIARAADAAYSGAVLPVFADILRQIGPQEASFLEACLTHLEQKARGRVGSKAYLWEIGTKPKLLLLYTGRSFKEITSEDEDGFEVSLANLLRLGLIGKEVFSQDRAVQDERWGRGLAPDGSDAPEGLWSDPVAIDHYFLTPFGHAFIQACHSPSLSP